MKFISCVVSTMLIVLISQHSIMGLPVDNTIVGKKCSEGYKMTKGRCIPINLDLNNDSIESSSHPSENIIRHQKKAFNQINNPDKFGTCPEGMERNKQGICQELELFQTTEGYIQLTTDYSDNGGGEVNLKDCPDGTEHDEQGYCQEIKSSDSTKKIIDPKVLLNKDGSCPINYKLVDKQCVYVEPKSNLTPYPSVLRLSDNISGRRQAKSGNDENFQYESVPVLPDNSCPVGTEYSSYGLCQGRNNPSGFIRPITPDGHCRDNYELIDGKCIHKSQSELATITSMYESTTLATKPINKDELSESISEIKFTTEAINTEKSNSQSRMKAML